MEEIETLVKLQAQDKRIAALRKETERIPQEIEELETELSGAKAQLEELRENQKSALKVRHKRETDLQALQEEQTRMRQQLLTIKTNRDYTAALQQLEKFKTEISTLEETILELMEDGERREREVHQDEDKLKEEEAKVRAEQDLLNKELAKVKDELGRSEEERAALAEGVPRDLLGRYERIRGHNNNVAVVSVSNGVCGGCFRRLPPQVALEVRKEEKLHYCQFCGRMLYYENDKPAGEGEIGA